MGINALNIGARLISAFAAILALTTGLSMFAIDQLAIVRQASTDITERWMAGARLTEELNTASSNFRIAETQHILSAEADEKIRYEKELRALSAKMQALSAEYTRLIATAAEKQAWNTYQRERQRYLDEHNRVLSLSRGGDADDATALLRYNSQQKYDRAAAALQKLVDDNVAGGAAARRSADTTYANARLWITGALVAALVMGAGLAFAITCSIVRPIRQALTLAQRTATGDLTTVVRAAGRDEPARLLGALGNMNAGLTTLVAEVRRISEQIAMSSGEIASGNVDLSKRTEQQATNVDAVVASMDRLTATIRHNADMTRDVAAFAAGAGASVDRGSTIMGDVVVTMDQITGASRKISDITSLIEAIAYQTNLLALNAAVEAARAGQAGRGFSVIAGEVRQLSNRITAAVQDIKRLIDDSTTKVDAGGRLVVTARASMDEIARQVLGVTQLVDTINVATSAQLAGVTTVLQAATELDAATQQNSALVEESAAASAMLAEQAQQLVNVVAAFKIGAGSPAQDGVDTPACRAHAAPSGGGNGPDAEGAQNVAPRLLINA